MVALCFLFSLTYFKIRLPFSSLQVAIQNALEVRQHKINIGTIYYHIPLELHSTLVLRHCVYIPLELYTYINVYKHLSIYMCTNMHIFTLVIYVYVYVYINTHIHIHILKKADSPCSLLQFPFPFPTLIQYELDMSL